MSSPRIRTWDEVYRATSRLAKAHRKRLSDIVSAVFTAAVLYSPSAVLRAFTELLGVPERRATMMVAELAILLERAQRGEL